MKNTMKKSFGPKTLIFPARVWVVGTYDAGFRLDQLIMILGSNN